MFMTVSYHIFEFFNSLICQRSAHFRLLFLGSWCQGTNDSDMISKTSYVRNFFFVTRSMVVVRTRAVKKKKKKTLHGTPSVKYSSKNWWFKEKSKPDSKTIVPVIRTGTLFQCNQVKEPDCTEK